MRFTAPLFLFLLLLLPLFAYLGWPSRGPNRRREWVSLALRLAIVLCLILGLAGTQAVRATDELAVVFLVDASDSMPAQAKAAAATYVRDALAGMKPADQAAVILFGGDALVERPMSPVAELGPITSVPSTLQTDLAEAIRLALALYPPHAAKRMVILSDGRATTGDAEEAAQLAAASGVQIVSVPFVVTPGPEALLSSVQAPANLRQGESFGLEVSVQATRAMRAGVRVLAGSEVVYEGTQDLNVGVNSFVIPLTAGEPGFSSYRVQIAPDTDGFYQNNELAAFSQVTGPPKVLLVAPPAGTPLGRDVRPDEYSQLVSALRASGVQVDAVPPSSLPTELSQLAGYASVLMVDVPAKDLSVRQMQAVQSFVRDLGGGLVVVGGPTSYGVGGYFHTPLEETLPVEMQIKDEQRRPSLALVFVIDKSGSMAEFSGGATKADLAKEAAIRSVELLSAGDKVGVVAFDESASWVVDVTELSDPQAVINRIGTIRPDGGTDIMAGLQAVARVLPDDDSQVKHVILLTDGGADETGIPELVRTLHDEAGVTLTTVGVGSDAAPYLPELAEIGGGRYHFAAEPRAIPSIFTEETLLATRSYIIEEEFFPSQVSPSPILAGIEETPALFGYVGTTIKPAAQSILISKQKDPVLAAWQYGLGRAVAWTSDATGRWATNWLNWAEFPKFWSQLVRYTINESAQSNVEVSVATQGDRARVTVDAQSEGADYLNGYRMRANIIGADGQPQAVDLVQVAPGRYEGEFTPTEPGAYLIRVDGSQPGSDASVAQTSGWVLSYSPEYRNVESDPAMLARLAAITGGGLGPENPAGIFTHDLPADRATRPIWPWLLALAALLLPFDIAVRRIVLGRYDLERAWGRVQDLVLSRLPRAAPVLEHARSAQFGALKRAKGRAGDSVAPPAMPEAMPRPTVAEPEPAPPRSDDGERAPVPPDKVPEPPVPAGEVAQPAGNSTTTASLLARKRARKEGKPD